MSKKKRKSTENKGGGGGGGDQNRQHRASPNDFLSPGPVSMSPHDIDDGYMMGKKKKKAQRMIHSNDAISHKDSDDRVFFDASKTSTYFEDCLLYTSDAADE